MVKAWVLQGGVGVYALRTGGVIGTIYDCLDKRGMKHYRFWGLRNRGSGKRVQGSIGMRIS